MRLSTTVVRMPSTEMFWTVNDEELSKGFYSVVVFLMLLFHHYPVDVHQPELEFTPLLSALLLRGFHKWCYPFVLWTIVTAIYSVSVLEGFYWSSLLLILHSALSGVLWRLTTVAKRFRLSCIFLYFWIVYSFVFGVQKPVGIHHSDVLDSFQ